MYSTKIIRTVEDFINCISGLENIFCHLQLNPFLVVHNTVISNNYNPVLDYMDLKSDWSVGVD